MTEFKVGDMVEIFTHDVPTCMRSWRVQLPMNTPLKVRAAQDGEGDCKVFNPDESDWEWVPTAALRLVTPVAPEPEITVRGHTYRLVEPEAPEPKAGQIWMDSDGDMYILGDEDGKGILVSAEYRGVIIDHVPTDTFVANSLREALESGKLKVSDL